MGPYLVLRYVPICHDANERIEGIVGKCPTVVGKGRGTRGIIGQEIWEQCPRDPLCFQRRISTGVLERVREAPNETCVVRRFPREVVISLPIDKYDSLRRPRPALRLDPAAPLTRAQRAGPQANLVRSQGRVGYFKNDAAYILVGEEIVAGELQVVLCALHIAEERIAAPAREEAIVAGLRDPCDRSCRNRCSFYDSDAAIARRGGLRALGTA